MSTDAMSASSLPQLLALSRQRRREQRSKLALEQIATATVKSALGFTTQMAEDDRDRIAESAEAVVKAAVGKSAADDLDDEQKNALDAVGAIVLAHHQVAKLHAKLVRRLEKPMTELVASLPIAAWVEAPEQRGLGLLAAALILGETGDLSLYANPAKVWKRMGCAPFQGRAPSTWRREGGLSAKDWVECGYSPQRRSLMFVLANNMVMQNKTSESDGPYRTRYLEAKRLAAISRPDWKPIRLHLHGNLLCAKRILREMWKAWNA